MKIPDNNIADILQNKSPRTIELVKYLISEYEQIGEINFHATKTMVVFSARINFAYIIQLGKDFIDVVFSFKQPYEDNLCFRKIKPVPGSNDYNHHLRIYYKEDINEEVLKYMQMAYQNGI